MLVFLFCFSLCACLLSGSLNNFFAKKKLTTIGDGYLFTLLRSIFCLTALFLFALCSRTLSVPSGFTALCGAAYGFLTFLSMVTNTLALSAGSYAATGLICSFQMVVPAFSGFFFWQEPIHYGQYVGMALLLVGQFLCLWQGKQKVSLKWFLYCLICVTATGTLGIVQKIHQNSEYKGELSGFMLVAFSCSVVFLLLAMLFIQRRPRMAVTRKPDMALWGIAAVAGLCVAANNQINTALAGQINSMIFFPTFNGLNLLLTLLISILLFRERFKVRQIVGFVIGLGGIVLLGNVLKLLTGA